MITNELKSLNRYKEIVYKEVNHEKPSKILEDIKVINEKISLGLDELEKVI